YLLDSVEFGCFNLNQEGKARCFRIYRETLSRFRAPRYWAPTGVTRSNTSTPPTPCGFVHGRSKKH
ncbi:hypothetical protein ABLO16_14100, partial [Mycobacterium tuberculosis]